MTEFKNIKMNNSLKKKIKKSTSYIKCKKKNKIIPKYNTRYYIICAKI